MLTLDQGGEERLPALYINSEVSYDFDDADLLNSLTLRMAGDDYARIRRRAGGPSTVEP